LVKKEAQSQAFFTKNSWNGLGRPTVLTYDMKISRGTRAWATGLTVLVAAAVLAPPTAGAAPDADHPACEDHRAITGTNGSDVLAGTDGDDVICGLGGNDEIDGGAGDDVLIGGGGNDGLTGGGGSDFCLGGDGDDSYAHCERCPTQAANTPIAFSRTNVKNGQGVYRMLPSGRRAHRLSRMKPPFEGHHYAPAWSPNGKIIAFEAGRNETYLYTMTARGTHRKQINARSASFTPDWSPDGTTIAYEIEDRDDESFDVFSVPARGGETTQLTSTSEGRFHPHYSPDGAQIALEGNTEEYSKRALVMAPDGSNEFELLPGHVSFSPTWSPNSENIVFAGAPSDGQRYDTPTDIYVVGRDGSSPTRLTDLGGIADYPEWSPDGRRIVFLHRDKGTHDIYSVAPDGSHLQRLTNDKALEYYAIWSPDATKIVFSRQHDNNYDLWMMNADGSNEHRITDTKAHELEPQWRPRPCDQ
jgi:TolB protein